MTSPKMTDTVFFDILSDIKRNVKHKIHSSIYEFFESEEYRIKKDSIKAESFLFAMRNPLSN
jgi:DNA-binding cell septation regulator SpoVG